MKLPIKIFNEQSLVSTQLPRYKKWDTFDVINKDFYFALSIADLGSNGLVRVTAFDYNTGKAKTITKQVAKDQIPRLSYTSYRYTNGTADDIYFEDSDLVFRVENIPAHLNARYLQRRIQVSSPSQDLKVDFQVNVSTDHEAICTVTPLDKTMQLFYYDISNGNLPAEGSVNLDGKEYTFDIDTAAAGQNYGRGIWSDNAYIVKARGQGALEDGRRFSLLLSSGFGDPEASKATGDAFIVDRFTFKLNAVGIELDENDLMKPINFKTLFNKKKDFKECRATFTPSHVEQQSVNEGGVQFQKQVVVGSFSGYVSDYRNKRYSFSDLKGMVEVTKMKIQE
jgi:hypothetical protein